MFGNLASQDNASRDGDRMRSSSVWKSFFLGRLRLLVAARRQQTPLADAGSLELRLLDKAVYSTFCDCLDLGVGGAARAILREGEAAAAVEAEGVDPN